MLINEQITERVMRDEIVVCDWDGVIQSIDVLWMVNMLKHEKLFEKYFDLNKLKDEKGEYALYKVLERDTYYINKWLLKDGVELPERIYDIWMDCYMKDNNFYENCPFLIMASSLKELYERKIIKEIHFVSQAPLGIETDVRKQPLLEKFFGKKPNITIDVIHGNMKKSEFINKNIPNYTTFIDDREDIVRDVIDNTDSANKIFLLPTYDYNKNFVTDNLYLTKASLNGTQISMYKNDFATNE